MKKMLHENALTNPFLGVVNLPQWVTDFGATFDHTTIALVAYSIVGSAMSELAAAYQYLCRNPRLPARYYTKTFYVVRTSLAVGAGVLPLIFGVTTPTAAFALGICAPVIIKRLGRVS
jgi:hypothetical protein